MNKLSYLIILFTLSAAANVYPQYYFNQYGVLDGVDDYFSTPSHSELNLDSAFTIECWIFLRDTTGFNKTVVSTVNSANNSGYSLLIKGSYANPGNAGKLQFNINGSNNIISQASGTRLALNNWNHIAVTFKDGGVNISDTIRFYINGIQALSLNRLNEPIANSNDSLRVGNCYLPGNFSNPFIGYIDDVRIYKTRRQLLYIANDRGVPVSFEGISDISRLNNSRYAYLTCAWKFDGSGDDYTGFPNDLVQNNGAGFYNTSFNPYAYRNQSNYYIKLSGQSWLAAPDTDVSSFDLDTACTIEVYVYPDSAVASTQTLISKGSNYKLGISNSKFYFSINSGTKIINSFSSVKLKQWTHVAATYVSSTGSMKIYLNGILDSSINFSPGNISVTNDSLYMGRSITGEYLFGKLDEVRISRAAKSQDFIKRYLFTNIDHNNGGQFDPPLNSYGFEGNTLDNVSQSKPLFIRGGAYFEWINNNNTAGGSSQAPLIRTELFEYGLTFVEGSASGFSIRNNSTVRDSIFAQGGILNYVYVILSHTFMDDVDISLRSPNGITVNLTTDRGSSFNDMCTVFSSSGDSNLSDNNAPFSMRINPQTSLTAFAGSSFQGYWRLTITDDNAGNTDSGRVYFWGMRFGPLPGISGNITEINFRLEQNYPNPFNPNTSIRYSLMEKSFTSLKIYNSLGKEVLSLVDQVQDAGEYDIKLSCTELNSGVYFYKLRSGIYTDTKRMLLIK